MAEQSNSTTTKATKTTTQTSEDGNERRLPRVQWDDRNMQSTYANVCNVQSTREEVVMLFGVNQAWNAAQSEVKIELTDRVILSPFAAKRMLLLLQNVIGQYEARFGALDVGTPKEPNPVES